MHERHPSLFATVFLVWTLLLSGTRLAQAEVSADSQIAAARTLGLEGLAAYERGDWAEASDKFERAYRLYPVPSLALWSGRVLARSGKLVEASERWLKATRLTVDGHEESQLAAQREAAAERRALLPRIPTLQVTLVGASTDRARFLIDSSELPVAALGSPLPLNPGAHEIAIQWPDRSAAAKVELAEGEQRKLELRPEPAAVTDLPTSVTGTAPQAARADVRRTNNTLERTWGWLALGIGAAGLATWGTTGLIAAGERRTLLDHCPNGNCPPAYHDTLDSYRTLRTVSGVGFAVGVIGASTGALLLLTTSGSANPAAAAAKPWRGWIGLNGIGFAGEY